MPRSYVVTRARVVDKEPAALEAILAPGFDRNQEAVLVGRPDAPELRALAEAPGTPFRPARILADAPERVVVQAVADRPSLLVVNARLAGPPMPEGKALRSSLTRRRTDAGAAAKAPVPAR